MAASMVKPPEKSGLIIPEKHRRMKALLSSFASTGESDTQGEEVSTPGKSDRGNATHRALDKQAYYNRVHSFHPLTWFAKPAWLSPLHCARYGWENVARDMLRCVTCQAHVSGHLPQSNDLLVYKKCMKRLQASVIDGHHTCCTWKSHQCPESFMEVDVSDTAEVLQELQSRVGQLETLGSKLPTLPTTLNEDMGLTDECLEHLRSLCAGFSASSASVSADLMEEDEVDLSVRTAALLLAVCGWSIRGTANCGILHCDFCNRDGGLWNFFSAAEPPTEQELPQVQPQIDNIGAVSLLSVKDDLLKLRALSPAPLIASDYDDASQQSNTQSGATHMQVGATMQDTAEHGRRLETVEGTFNDGDSSPKDVDAYGSDVENYKRDVDADEAADVDATSSLHEMMDHAEQEAGDDIRFREMEHGMESEDESGSDGDVDEEEGDDAEDASSPVMLEEEEDNDDEDDDNQYEEFDINEYATIEPAAEITTEPSHEHVNHPDDEQINQSRDEEEEDEWDIALNISKSSDEMESHDVSREANSDSSGSDHESGSSYDDDDYSDDGEDRPVPARPASDDIHLIIDSSSDESNPANELPTVEEHATQGSPNTSYYIAETGENTGADPNSPEYEQDEDGSDADDIGHVHDGDDTQYIEHELNVPASYPDVLEDVEECEQARFDGDDENDDDLIPLNTSMDGCNDERVSFDVVELESTNDHITIESSSADELNRSNSHRNIINLDSSLPENNDQYFIMSTDGCDDHLNGGSSDEESEGSVDEVVPDDDVEVAEECLEQADDDLNPSGQEMPLQVPEFVVDCAAVADIEPAEECLESSGHEGDALTPPTEVLGVESAEASDAEIAQEKSEDNRGATESMVHNVEVGEESIEATEDVLDVSVEIGQEKDRENTGHGSDEELEVEEGVEVTECGEMAGPSTGQLASELSKSGASSDASNIKKSGASKKSRFNIDMLLHRKLEASEKDVVPQAAIDRNRQYRDLVPLCDPDDVPSGSDKYFEDENERSPTQEGAAKDGTELNEPSQNRDQFSVNTPCFEAGDILGVAMLEADISEDPQTQSPSENLQHVEHVDASADIEDGEVGHERHEEDAAAMETDQNKPGQPLLVDADRDNSEVRDESGEMNTDADGDAEMAADAVSLGADVESAGKKRDRLSADGDDVERDGEGQETTSTDPQPKRRKLFMQRTYFHPLKEHKLWCPWVTPPMPVDTDSREQLNASNVSSISQPGWKRLLDVLLAQTLQSINDQSFGSCVTNTPSHESLYAIRRLFQEWLSP